MCVSKCSCVRERNKVIIGVCTTLVVLEAQADEARRPFPTDRNHPPPLTRLEVEIINYASTFLIPPYYLPTLDNKETKDNKHTNVFLIRRVYK